MFQFRRFPTYAYLIQRRLTEYCSAGFPHSEICGLTVICSSPQLIAACHVLLRLLMPRHSPCALSSLTYFLLKKKVGKENFALHVWLRSRLLFPFHFLFQFKKGLSSGSLWVWIMQASEFYEIVCVTLLKVPQIIYCFPSVTCSSYIWLLCSVFKVQFPTSSEVRFKHLTL